MDDLLLSRTKAFVQEQVLPWMKANAGTYPSGIVEQMRDLGLFGMAIQKEYGGLELKPSAIAAIIQEIARGCVSLTAILGSHTKVTSYLKNFGTSEQKAYWLPRMANGECIAAHALTELTGKELDTLETLLSSEDGLFWILNGSKTFVTNAKDADVIAVVTKIHQENTGQSGNKFGIVLIPKGTSGLLIGEDIERLGWHETSLCPISFRSHQAKPEEQLIGGLGGNAKKMMASVKIAELTSYAARAVGVMEAVIEICRTEILLKESGGRRLSDIQLVRVRVAEMNMKHACASLALQAFLRKCDEETASLVEVYSLKAFLSEMAVEVAQKGMTLCGGKGYTKEGGIERLLRDAIALTTVGTPTDVCLHKIGELVLGDV